ncbi:hypothetical protein QL285_033006 [Trifolium repens]|nr:hypothetical protein QL285_033006 [Trifolium repens]
MLRRGLQTLLILSMKFCFSQKDTENQAVKAPNQGSQVKRLPRMLQAQKTRARREQSPGAAKKTGFATKGTSKSTRLEEFLWTYNDDTPYEEYEAAVQKDTEELVQKATVNLLAYIKEKHKKLDAKASEIKPNFNYQTRIIRYRCPIVKQAEEEELGSDLEEFLWTYNDDTPYEEYEAAVQKDTEELGQKATVNWLAYIKEKHKKLDAEASEIKPSSK